MRYKILWDFEIQTDHLILARRPDLELIRFGLVSLFNGISTFVGYLMPKPFP